MESQIVVLVDRGRCRQTCWNYNGVFPPILWGKRYRFWDVCLIQRAEVAMFVVLQMGVRLSDIMSYEWDVD